MFFSVLLTFQFFAPREDFEHARDHESSKLAKSKFQKSFKFRKFQSRTVIGDLSFEAFLELGTWSLSFDCGFAALCSLCPPCSLWLILLIPCKTIFRCPI